MEKTFFNNIYYKYLYRFLSRLFIMFTTERTRFCWMKYVLDHVQLYILGIDIPIQATDVLLFFSVGYNPIVSGAYHCFLYFFIICHDSFPDSLHSQKIQPLTEFPVIEIAAEDGDENLFPFKTNAPSSTVA